MTELKYKVGDKVWVSLTVLDTYADDGKYYELTSELASDGVFIDGEVDEVAIPLPVIPQFVADWIEKCKKEDMSLSVIGWEQIKSEFTFGYFADENLVFMQSTGLFDKNGVEIYAGDVVKLGTKDLYVVKWSEREAAYKLISVDKQWSDCYFSNYENITEIIEVIGNIYENPDLVEKT